MRQVVCVVGMLVVSSEMRGQPAPPADLALQTRAILHKRCSECHGGPKNRSEMSVLSRVGLNRFSRRFTSLQDIIDLVEDGSMPPGDREAVPPAERKILRDWYAAGAPGYVQIYDDEYVLSTLLADVQKRSEDELPFVRFISLAHEVNDAGTALEPRRAALRQALAGLTKGGALQPLDPTETLFRFDLREAGWSDKVFETVREVNEKEVRDELPWTIYDAVLLEYPLGVYFDDVKSFAPLRAAFLRKAKQVRPVAFLRAEWVADTLPKLSVAAELRRHFGKPAIAPVKMKPIDFNPGGRTPILPLDALSRDAVEADPLPFKVNEFDILDVKTHQSEYRFKIGDAFKVAMQFGSDVFFELVFTAANGEKVASQAQRVDRNAPCYFPKDNEGLRIIPESPVGKSQVTLYAAEAKFPVGELWTGKGAFADRVVHRFYDVDKPLVDASKIIKRTVTIEIRK